MSTTAYSSHLQTRQQLDELDALLQRMLDLPMKSEPQMPAPSAVTPEAYAPLPPNLPQANAAPRPLAGSEHVLHAWRMTPPPEPPAPAAAAAEPPASSRVTQEAPYPYSMVYGQPMPAEALPPFAEPVIIPAPATYAAPQWATPAASSLEPSKSFLLTPIIVVNHVFDGLSYLLGPLGAWLRQPAGRKTLGWLGVAMIFGAIGWAVVDCFGADWNR